MELETKAIEEVLRENIDNSIKELLKNDNNLDTEYITKTINNFNQKGA